jgi:hypothetical protein
VGGQFFYSLHLGRYVKLLGHPTEGHIYIISQQSFHTKTVEALGEREKILDKDLENLNIHPSKQKGPTVENTLNFGLQVNDTSFRIIASGMSQLLNEIIAPFNNKNPPLKCL